MTQIFETHLHFTAGIHGEVGTASGQVLWKAVAATGQVLWRVLWRWLRQRGQGENLGKFSHVFFLVSNFHFFRAEKAESK